MDTRTGVAVVVAAASAAAAVGLHTFAGSLVVVKLVGTEYFAANSSGIVLTPQLATKAAAGNYYA